MSLQALLHGRDLARFGHAQKNVMHADRREVVPGRVLVLAIARQTAGQTPVHRSSFAGRLHNRDRSRHQNGQADHDPKDRRYSKGPRFVSTSFNGLPSVGPNSRIETPLMSWTKPDHSRCKSRPQRPRLESSEGVNPAWEARR